MILTRRTSTGIWLVVSTVLAIAGCQTSSTSRAPAIGEAFAGPASLEIRKEIALKSGTAAIVHYGDKLQILQQRRHFMKVRTAKGAEGWVDERLLLDNTAMQALEQLSKDTKKYPSQGKATTYDLLNVHTEPNRASPSYLQVQAGERVDVIGHKLAPRVSPVRKNVVIAPPKPRTPRQKKKTKSSRVAPPPAPPAPKPPEDWVELSKERTPPPEEEPEDKEPPEPVPTDDWTLIRNAKGQSGWVLTRRIYMAIPDEVAQYAEGKRISSYFSLGKVVDEESGTKEIWLWTTIGSGAYPFDFDSFRVFIWNLRRHRYETAYIQRRIEGYFPVRASEGKFSLVIGKEDGRHYRQRYSMAGNRVQPEGEELELPSGTAQ